MITPLPADKTQVRAQTSRISRRSPASFASGSSRHTRHRWVPDALRCGTVTVTTDLQLTPGFLRPLLSPTESHAKLRRPARRRSRDLLGTAGRRPGRGMKAHETAQILVDLSRQPGLWCQVLRLPDQGSCNLSVVEAAICNILRLA